MPSDNKAMAAALAADGDKLRGLTGQDHGPSWFLSCTVCGQFWLSQLAPDCGNACPECGACPECSYPLEPYADD